MDRLNLRSPWHEVRERLKENDINLTDDDLDYRPGDDDKLLDKLAAKLNKSKKQVKDYIESISDNDDKSG
jgi:uncharacterized protein YjbJ (UPF0337 family)